MEKNNIEKIIENILERIFVFAISGFAFWAILRLLTVVQDFRNYGICWEGKTIVS